jgi:hypothetical protein
MWKAGVPLNPYEKDLVAGGGKETERRQTGGSRFSGSAGSDCDGRSARLSFCAWGSAVFLNEAWGQALGLPLRI